MKFKFLLLLSACVFIKNASAQIPILNSSPAITNKVIYLDFDGQVVSGTMWNNGATINALPSIATAATIRNVWNRMSEDYRPFDVNITTDSMRFNNANPATRIRVIFTPTYQWFGNGAGGVAFVGSFTWGGTPGTPCWIFESQLGNGAKNMGEAASHEVGHTLSLKHQSTYNSACTKTNEYNPGLGTGVTSWAPIMGVGYSKNITLFHNGKSADGCNLIQDDLSNSFQAGITGLPYLNYLPDDIGNTFTNAKWLNLNTTTALDSGLINTSGDIDAFRFTICANRYVSINAKPWALDTTTYTGANMDVKLKLYNAAGNLLAGDSAQSKLTGLVGMNLTPGSYFFTIDGDASAYYTDYGVLGKYYVNIKTNNPPAITNTITLSNGICAPQTLSLTFGSNLPTSVWQWTVSGSNTSTFNTQNPVYTFSTAGIYTLALLANSSTSTSCVITKTYNIGSPPSLTVSATAASICPQNTATISVSGASTYTWLPGNLSGNYQIVTYNSVNTYTILGSNGSCSASISKSVGLSPNFTLNLTNTALGALCPGKTATLNPSGAINYTLLPSGSTITPFVVQPSVNTTYTVIATNNACTRTKTSAISVLPSFTIGVDRSDSVVCANQPVTIFAYGGNNSFTTNPGNIVGYQVMITPSVSTVFTVTGIDANQCTTDSTFYIRVLNCDYLGLTQQSAASGLLIYPNPAKDQINLHNQGNNNTCSVYDATCKCIYHTELKPNDKQSIQTATWPSGIYIFRFNNGEGIRVVKE